VLLACAVAAERDAILAAVPDAEMLVTGVGPAAAAATTSAALARARYDVVVCAGIGGGFGTVAPGDIAVASSIVFADLGAQTGDGFVPISELGFGTETYAVAPRFGVELADRTGGHLGTVLTVATVTGTAERAAELAGRYPDAVAEGMEGAGVAAAATLHEIAYGEIRSISNAVGPRNRDAWDIPHALDCLGLAVASMLG
jgi:futalosine hydrolase